MRQYFVYVLASHSRTLYIGVTHDLQLRLHQHRHNTSHFSARHRIHKLVHCEQFSQPRAAIAREKQLKGWIRAKKVALIEKHNPFWLDLAPPFPD